MDRRRLLMVMGGASKYSTISAPDAAFNFVPFLIQRSKIDGSIQVDPTFNIQSRAGITVSKTYYVTMTGNDTTGNGLTEGTAFRSLNKAVGMADVDRVLIKGGYYQWAYSASNVNIARSLEIIGYGGTVNLTTDIHRLVGAFSAVDTHYSAALAAAPYAVHDGGTLNAFGDASILTKMTSEAEVEATAGSWYHASGTIYIRLPDDRAPDTDVKYFYGDVMPYATRDNLTIYLENLDFQGGSAGMVIGNASSTGGMKFYAKNCTWKYSAADGVDTAGLTEAIFEDCIASTNQGDGFSHASKNTIADSSIEINCQGYNNGKSGYAYNGSTGHNSTIIVRIGGTYYTTRGINVYDIGPGKTWCLDCEAYDAEGVSPPDTLYNSSFGAGTQSGARNMWLDTCYSHDQLNFDLYIEATCAIYTRNCTLAVGANSGSPTPY